MVTRILHFFQVVDAHNGVYRCKQPRQSMWPIISDKLKVKTVLNLRDDNHKNAYFELEKAYCKEHNIKLEVFKCNASKGLTDFQIQWLFNFFSNCAYPLLIHCKAGSDRTGLVSALYSLLIEKDLPEALRQLQFFSAKYWFHPHTREDYVKTLHQAALMLSLRKEAVMLENISAAKTWQKAA